MGLQCHFFIENSSGFELVKLSCIFVAQLGEFKRRWANSGQPLK